MKSNIPCYEERWVHIKLTLEENLRTIGKPHIMISFQQSQRWFC